MATSIPNDLAWRLLATMLLIRRFEEAVLRLAKEERFVGHYHLYIGQEATGAGVMACLEPRDHLATTHRNHGHVIARGADPGRSLAEILGRAAGLNGGRGGTIHLSDPSLGFLLTSAIVGGAISLGVGGGYACRQRGDRSVTVAFFGDGALDEGISFESLNVASLWRLPVVFLCENNSVNAWGPSKDGYPTLNHAGSKLCNIAQSVGISTMRVNGADAAAVYEAANDAVARCRAGNGPVFIEAVTKRWVGSSRLWPEPVTGITDLGMATGEMPIPDEHRDWFERHDPVLALSRLLVKGDGEAARRLHALDADSRARIGAAIEFALRCPMPEAATALDHIFAA